MKGERHTGSLTQDRLSSPVALFGGKKKLVFQSRQAQTEMIMSRGQAMAPISIETKTIRKLKIRILPFILLLYIVSFLDRINISFAKLTMNQDLAITSHQFGLAVRDFLYRLFSLRDSEQSPPAQNRRPHLAGAHPDYLGNYFYAHRVCAKPAATLPGALLTRVRRSGLFPRNYFIFDLLVSPTRTGPGARAVVNRHTYYKHPGSSAFRPYPRPRTLVGAQQLALAPYSGGTSGLGRWCADLLLAPQSTGGSQVPCRRRKGLDHSRIKTGRRTQAANSSGLGSTSVGRRPCLASRIASVLPWAPRYS